MMISPLVLVIHSYKYSHHIEPFTPVSHSGVEKNDDGKQHYFSNNRHDAAMEIVCADERLDILRADWQRGKRRYRKRQTEEQDEQLQAKWRHTDSSNLCCHPLPSCAATVCPPVPPPSVLLTVPPPSALLTVLPPSALLPLPVTIKTAFLKANHIHKRFHWS